MEPEGLVSEASWNSFDVAMSTEESEMIAQLLGGHQLLHELDKDPSIEMPPIFWQDHGADQYYSLDETVYDPYYFSQGTSSSSISSFSLPLAYNGGCCYSSDSNAGPEFSTTPTTTVDFSIEKEQLTSRSLAAASRHQFNESVCAIKKTSSEEFGVSKEKSPVPALPPHQNSEATKRRIHGSDVEQPTANEKDSTLIESPKKKARASAPVPKKGKNAQSKKAQKSASTGNEEDSNADLNGQSSSCYSSEDDSNASQELNGGAAPSPNGKTRAGRRSATDPQSLYARKRRERINKRLRILQNLVPNGTKVDISTMLEEAVQYVKFLQLQIKLLSSDELWMYAPIAYNGIDIGL